MNTILNQKVEMFQGISPISPFSQQLLLLLLVKVLKLIKNRNSSGKASRLVIYGFVGKSGYYHMEKLFTYKGIKEKKLFSITGGFFLKMMFKIKGGDFSRKLGMIQGVVEKRTTMPILSHVLISSTDKGLFLEATDLENTATVFCDAETEGEFKVAVPAGILSDLVREIKEEEEIFGYRYRKQLDRGCHQFGFFQDSGACGRRFSQNP